MLASFWRRAEPVCWPSVETLVDLTKRSNSTIRWHLSELQRLGFIARSWATIDGLTRLVWVFELPELGAEAPPPALDVPAPVELPPLPQQMALPGTAEEPPGTGGPEKPVRRTLHVPARKPATSCRKTGNLVPVFAQVTGCIRTPESGKRSSEGKLEAAAPAPTVSAPPDVPSLSQAEDLRKAILAGAHDQRAPAELRADVALVDTLVQAWADAVASSPRGAPPPREGDEREAVREAFARETPSRILKALEGVTTDPWRMGAEGPPGFRGRPRRVLEDVPAWVRAWESRWGGTRRRDAYGQLVALPPGRAWTAEDERRAQSLAWQWAGSDWRPAAAAGPPAGDDPGDVLAMARELQARVRAEAAARPPALPPRVGRQGRAST